MKYFPVFLLFLLCPFQLNSQIIKGNVIDASNGEALEYVSIGIIETSVGTITDEKGNFSLNVKGQLLTAKVRFSMIGFKAQTFTIEELSDTKKMIKLETDPIQLSEVIVKPKSNKLKKVGVTSYTWRGGFCGWGGTHFGNGNEIGTKIELGTLPVKVKSLHIRLGKQSFDSSLFRLHIRNIVNNLPSNELLNDNILISITKKSGWIDIDLNKYNLVFNGDIALTLEWIKVFGESKAKPLKVNDAYTLCVLFNVKKGQGYSYSKWGAENNWKQFGDSNPSFYLMIQE